MDDQVEGIIAKQPFWNEWAWLTWQAAYECVFDMKVMWKRWSMRIERCQRLHALYWLSIARDVTQGSGGQVVCNGRP